MSSVTVCYIVALIAALVGADAMAVAIAIGNDWKYPFMAAAMTNMAIVVCIYAVGLAYLAWR